MVAEGEPFSYHCLTKTLVESGELAVVGVNTMSIPPLAVNVLDELGELAVSPADRHVDVLVTWLPWTTTVNVAVKATGPLEVPAETDSSQQSPAITRVAESCPLGQVVLP
jgi:hypothetical protein